MTIYTLRHCLRTKEPVKLISILFTVVYFDKTTTFTKEVTILDPAWTKDGSIIEIAKISEFKTNGLELLAIRNEFLLMYFKEYVVTIFLCLDCVVSMRSILLPCSGSGSVRSSCYDNLLILYCHRMLSECGDGARCVHIKHSDQPEGKNHIQA